MIEHPVPQNITAYEFRLIGNMTIKQFVLLGSGGVMAFFVYSTNLPTFFKWPIIVVAIIIGIALAFMPYEERSLDQWFLNFFKAMYRPTKFYWRRIPHPPDFFTFTPSPGVMADSQRPDMTPYRTTQVKEFLSSLTPEEIAGPVDELDLFRTSAAIGSLFGQVEAASNVVPGTTQLIRKPSLQARPRPLRQKVESAAAEVMIATTPSVFAAAAPGTSTTMAPSTVRPVFTVESAAPEPEPVATEAKRSAAVVVPVEQIAVNQQVTARPIAPDAIPMGVEPVAAAPTAYQATTEELVSHGTNILPAVFNRDLPFPTTAEKPNLLIGMVHDKNKAIVPEAIVEIIDDSGNTVRAMKTNNLGQFYIAAALKDGNYTLHTEKEGLTFPIFSFSATGSVLDPVDIIASG